MATDSNRISRLEGIVESTNERLVSIDNRIGVLENRFTSLESKIETRFNWHFGLIVSTWITTIAAIITILVRG